MVYSIKDGIAKQIANLTQPWHFMPDWSKNENPVNEWENGLEFEVKEPGYAFVSIEGLNNFQLKIDSYVLLEKNLDKDDENIEILFSQIFPVNTGDKVVITENSNLYKNIYKCFFIPLLINNS